MQSTERYDVVIHNGEVLDGSGSEPVRADVGIRDDKIAAIGDLSEAEAGRKLDASGKRVAPGFVDIHTHSDISALFNPTQESIVSQGVTTQIAGNCGLSLGLATSDDVFAFEKRWLRAHGIKITWKSMAEHLKRVEDSGLATNYVVLAGQGTLRKRVMGQDDRPPDHSEMERMKSDLVRAMDEGAWGISTGLEYSPSRYANVDELSELSETIGRLGGFYATHLRNEGDTLEEAVAEAIQIGERAGIPVQLSHHKAEGKHNWGKVHRTIKMVEEARTNGLDIQMDQYPYTAFQTAMSVQFLPDWVNVGDNDAVLGRLADPEQRTAIVADIRARHAEWDSLGPDSPWDNVEIAASRSNRSLQGRSVGSLARELDRNPIELVMDIILEEKNFISAVNFAISEDDILFVMRHPLTMIGSDAVGTSPYGKMGEDRVHPRCYGTFPRVLGRYVREKQALAESEAIRKMTSMPAERIGLARRGRIMEGFFADLVVYDSGSVADESTFAEPHRFARGIEATLVNGRFVWERGVHTKSLPGRVLRKGESSA